MPEAPVGHKDPHSGRTSSFPRATVGPWTVFGVCSALFIMSMFYRVSAAIIAPELTLDLSLNPRGLGLVGGVFFYAFALVQIPLGVLLDRTGAKRTILALNLIGVFGAILFSRATGLHDAVIGRTLLGIGMAANLMGSLKLFINWFDQNRFATLSGLIISMGTIGTLAATSPLALLVKSLGWRNSFLVLAGIHSLVILIFTLLVRNHPTDAPHGHARQRSAKGPAPAGLPLPEALGRLFRNKDYWAISFSIFLRYGSFASIQALWAGPFLMDLLGLSTVTAGNLLLILSVGYILGAPFGGYVSDRVLRSRKWAMVYAISVSALAILVWSRWRPDYPVALLGLLLFVSGFFNAFNQISFAHIRDLMPREMSGTAMSGINVFTMTGAGVFIHGLGGMMEILQAGSETSGDLYRLAFLICFAAVALSVLLYTLTTDSRS